MQVDGGELHVEVVDNGRSQDVARPAREGVGLSNTRARLAQKYRDDYSLVIARRADGFSATLIIPWQTA